MPHKNNKKLIDHAFQKIENEIIEAFNDIRAKHEFAVSRALISYNAEELSKLVRDYQEATKCRFREEVPKVFRELKKDLAWWQRAMRDFVVNNTDPEQPQIFQLLVFSLLDKNRTVYSSETRISYMSKDPVGETAKEQAD